VKTKCIVHGCAATCATDGDWVCSPCFVTLNTGIIGPGETFIHDLRNDLAAAVATIESLALAVAIEVIAHDGEVDDDDFIAQLRN